MQYNAKQSAPFRCCLFSNSDALSVGKPLYRWLKSAVQDTVHISVAVTSSQVCGWCPCCRAGCGLC